MYVAVVLALVRSSSSTSGCLVLASSDEQDACGVRELEDRALVGLGHQGQGTAPANEDGSWLKSGVTCTTTLLRSAGATEKAYFAVAERPGGVEPDSPAPTFWALSKIWELWLPAAPAYRSTWTSARLKSVPVPLVMVTVTRTPVWPGCTYVAKYTTKSVETAGALDHRITSLEQIRTRDVTPHIRALIGTAWRLGGLPELEHLRLRARAHILGYRGHCLTKTRTYSTTYGHLRAVRTEHARAAAGRTLYGDWDDGTATESTWRFIGTGHTPGEALLAAGIAEDIACNREIAREATSSVQSADAYG